MAPSSRLCTSTNPVRSQIKILILSARLARNTNAAPLYGSRPCISCTAAASPSRPRRKSTGRVATRSSDRRPVQSSRCPDRSDHLRQLLDINRRSDHHVADYDFHLRRGRLRRSRWRRCGINHQGRERCRRALWQRQLTLPKPPTPIVNLPACHAMLARHRRHLSPRQQALRRYPRLLRIRANPSSCRTFENLQATSIPRR